MNILGISRNFLDIPGIFARGCRGGGAPRPDFWQSRYPPSSLETLLSKEAYPNLAALGLPHSRHITIQMSGHPVFPRLSPKPAQFVCTPNKITEKWLVLIDACRCRKNCLTESTYPFSVFCAHDEFSTTGGSPNPGNVGMLKLGDFNWIDMCT